MKTKYIVLCLNGLAKWRNARGESRHPALMGSCLTFSYIPWPYRSTKRSLISPFQVVCETSDSVATIEVPLSWKESWHEMYAAKRT